MVMPKVNPHPYAGWRDVARGARKSADPIFPELPWFWPGQQART